MLTFTLVKVLFSPDNYVGTDIAVVDIYLSIELKFEFKIRWEIFQCLSCSKFS